MPVNYTKVGWVNRVVQRPRTYTETTNQDSSVTHTPAPGTVIQAGTPRSAENMDHMDQGIKDCADMANALEAGLRQAEETLNVHNTRINNNERGITDIQRVNEQQSGKITALTEAHNGLAEDEAELEASAYGHIGRSDNPHAVDLFQAAKKDFQSAWGDPAAAGIYVGNGSAQATLTVNGASVRGQKIDLSFTPSKIAIFIPYTELVIGHTESSLLTYNPLDVACGAKMGVVLIGPGLNYYHSGCGNLRTAEPQRVLLNNHGGAVVYGNSFIVQSMSNNDSDTTMRINSKNVRYMYLAWR